MKLLYKSSYVKQECSISEYKQEIIFENGGDKTEANVYKANYGAFKKL